MHHFQPPADAPHSGAPQKLISEFFKHEKCSQLFIGVYNRHLPSLREQNDLLCLTQHGLLSTYQLLESGG
jgi:hypothetical protein